MIQEKDKYRLLIENLPDGFAYCKMVRDNTRKPVDYIFLEINSFFEVLTGLPRDHIIGKKLTEVRPGIEDLGFDWIGVFDQVTAIGTDQMIHFQEYLDQQDRWYEITAYRDQPGYLAVVFRDITENKKTEEELRQREKNFSTLIENNPDMIVRFNLDLQHIYVNAAVEHQFGVPVHRFIGKTFLEIDGPPEQFKSMHQLLKKALKTGKEQQTEQSFSLPSGQKYFQTRIVPERDEKGRIESLLAVTRDITERKQAEEKLSQTKEYLENLIKYANAPIMVWDTSLSITRFNRAFENLSGYLGNEVIGKKIDILFSKDKMESALGHIQKTASGEKWKTVEIEIQRKDGEPRIVLWNSANILDTEKNKIIATIAQGQDITERKQAEEALLKALAQANEGKRTLDALMEQVPEGITIADAPDVLIRMVSRYGRELTGKSKEILEGITVDKHTQQWDIYCNDGMTPAKNEDLPLTRATQEGELVKDEEWVLGNQFNERIPILCNAGPIRNEEGKITGGVIAWRDITERRQAEERIKHLNLVLRAIRSVNQLIVKEKNCERLLKGICNNLIETRGYHSAWIALLDESGKLGTYAEAGIGKAILPMVKMLKKGELVVCGKKALKQHEVVTIKNPASTCPECPLIKHHFSRRVMTIRLEHDKKVYGLMSVSIPDHLVDDQEEQSLFREVAEDITFGIHNIELNKERIQAEEDLKDSEEHFKILFDYAPDPYYIIDSKGILVDGNIAAERLVGYKKEELIGKKFLKLKLISLAYISKSAKSFAKNIIGQPKGPEEFVLNRKDNSEVTVETSTYPVKIKGRTFALGIARDITERKQAEENLKNTKDELQIIMDSVPAIIFYKDTEGRIIRTNKTLADSLKVPIKDIVGKTTEELFPREQADKMRKDDKEVIISGKAKRNIIQPYTTPDGIRCLISDKVPYRDKEGKVSGVIDLGKDITAERRSEEELKQSYQRLKKTMDATIETMSKIVEAKDPYTAGHQQRVSQLATVIAKELNFSEDKVEGIRIASLIHDIGKIGLPTEILSKPSKLTDIEFNLIKGHSQIGHDILKSIEFSFPIAQIVLQHHERLNGSGYPNNLQGDKILLEAKIIGVADVVEAISSHRPYRPALGIDAALEEISKNRGVLYDPGIVDACLKLFKEKGFKFL